MPTKPRRLTAAEMAHETCETLLDWVRDLGSEKDEVRRAAVRNIRRLCDFAGTPPQNNPKALAWLQNVSQEAAALPRKRKRATGC